MRQLNRTTLLYSTGHRSVSFCGSTRVDLGGCAVEHDELEQAESRRKERGAGVEPEPSGEGVAVELAISASVMEAAHGQRRVE